MVRKRAKKLGRLFPLGQMWHWVKGLPLNLHNFGCVGTEWEKSKKGRTYGGVLPPQNPQQKSQSKMIHRLVEGDPVFSEAYH